MAKHDEDLGTFPMPGRNLETFPLEDWERDLERCGVPADEINARFAARQFLLASRDEVIRALQRNSVRMALFLEGATATEVEVEEGISEEPQLAGDGGPQEIAGLLEQWEQDFKVGAHVLMRATNLLGGEAAA